MQVEAAFAWTSNWQYVGVDVGDGLASNRLQPSSVTPYGVMGLNVF